MKLAAAGSNLQAGQCPQDSTETSDCLAAFLALHLTTGCTAYMEVCITEVTDQLDSVEHSTFPQGAWIWLADHDLELDSAPLLTIFAGRGVLSESQGPVFFIGGACKFCNHRFSQIYSPKTSSSS